MFCKGLYLFQNPRNSKLQFRQGFHDINGLATDVDDAAQKVKNILRFLHIYHNLIWTVYA